MKINSFEPFQKLKKKKKSIQKLHRRVEKYVYNWMIPKLAFSAETESFITTGFYGNIHAQNRAVPIFGLILA